MQTSIITTTNHANVLLPQQAGFETTIRTLAAYKHKGVKIDTHSVDGETPM